MRDLLALGFDGTLVTSSTDRPLPGAVRAVAALASDLPVAIVTNQGGPAFRVTGSLRHPAPSEVAEHLDRGLRAVGLPPARVARILICTWPGETWRGQPAEGLAAADVAAEQLGAILPQLGWAQAYATASPPWRKPAPGMLTTLAIELLTPSANILFVGGRPSDRDAARAAGCRFQWAKDWWR